MSKSNVNKLYKDAWYFSKSKDRAFNLDDTVFVNLLEELEDLLNDNPLYCVDILISCTERFLEDDLTKDRIDTSRGENLVENIVKTFDLNKKTHYLLIPFNGAELSSDIYFGSYSFITGSTEEKEKKIRKITEIDECKIHNFVEHTQKSRSRDFMKNPILVLRIDHINSVIYRCSSEAALKIFQIVKLMIYNLETKQDLCELTSNFYKNNYHVAILGEEEWQFGHGCWWNLVQCKYSLDFLSKVDNQKDFTKLVNAFFLEKRNDEMYYKFSNALKLFENSLEQCENNRDVTLSTILLFTAAESLLTENQNEKKFRLSVIWPRLVSISGIKQNDLCRLVRDTYNKRNDFIHAGHLFTYDKSEIRVLHQMLAKLIFLYLQPSEWKETTCETSVSDITAWDNYINRVFEQAIYN